MKLLYIFLSLFIILGCRTSKNIVEKSKESISKSEIKINKVDSVVKIDKLTKIDNSFQSQLSDFKEKLDISFNGLSNDDEFEFKFTENGFTAKGKGSVNQKTETNKKDSTVNNKVDETFKENSDIKKNEVNQNKVDESKSKVDKKKENKSTGFNWNFTIVLIIIGTVAVILFWKFGLPKLKSK
ncbi:MAG TPA: hypothetical protein DCR77_00355 [Flavobacteriaceae bacterium]|nr:hypothetical protein [Flavobacteriaceae bacterium]